MSDLQSKLKRQRTDHEAKIRPDEKVYLNQI